MSQPVSDNTAIQGGTADSPKKRNPRGKVRIILIMIVLYYILLFFLYIYYSVLYYTNATVILVCWLWSKNDDCQFV